MAYSDTWKAHRMAALAVAVTFVFMLLCLGVVEVVGDVAAGKALEGQAADGGSTEVVEVPDEPFYLLLIGSDSRKGTALYTGKANEHSQVDQHSDIMTLMRVDPSTPTITLVTIPRDTQLEGSSGKINEALAADNDPEAVVSAAERLTGVDIPYYAMVTFIGFEDLVDDLGGLTVDVPQTVTVPDPSDAQDVKVKAGEDKHLDGSEALVVARARKEYGADQEALRQVNVRNLETAIIQKGIAMVADSEDGASAADSLVALLLSNAQSNMDSAVMSGLIERIAQHADLLTIYSCTGPYSGGENDDGLWVVPEDPETWGALMAAVDSGQDPSGVVQVPEFEGK